MSVRLRRLAADVRGYIASLPDETPAATRRRLLNWADELEEAGGYADDTAVLPFVIHQMDSWVALDAPYPDRRLVIEWIGRLQTSNVSTRLRPYPRGRLDAHVGEHQQAPLPDSRVHPPGADARRSSRRNAGTRAGTPDHPRARYSVGRVRG